MGWGRGVRICLCVRPRPHSLPRPSPNLRSDVAPSYSTFPGVSFPSRQSPGASPARPPTPADTARRAGRGGGGTPALRVPSRPLRPAPGGGGERHTDTGVSTGSARHSPSPAPRHLSPCTSTEAGSGPVLGPGQEPGPESAGPSLQLAPLTPGHSQRRRKGARRG